MASSITTLAQVDTQFSADSVEWCPTNPAYFVCGTYQLIEGTSTENKLKSSENNSRIGSIILFKFDSTSKSLSRVQTVSTAAITDMKWYSHNGESFLGVTSSSGKFKLYSIANNNDSGNLANITSVDVSSPNLSLSLDWSCKTEPKVAVSDSGGCISVVKLSENSSKALLDKKWKAHNFDAWITAYDRWNTHIVYSGGDDCLLKGWDTRTECNKPIFVNKNHTMGVCALQSSSLVEHLFASGSYDEQVHIWDSRTMRDSLMSCNVGGGVWRLKWHPQKANFLLAACCHSGFHVLKVDTHVQNKAEVIASYTEHESLAYGADWGRSSCFDDVCGLHEAMATCSFYDHRLDLWELTYSNNPMNYKYS